MFNTVAPLTTAESTLPYWRVEAGKTACDHNSRRHWALERRWKYLSALSLLIVTNTSVKLWERKRKTQQNMNCVSSRLSSLSAGGGGEKVMSLKNTEVWLHKHWCGCAGGLHLCVYSTVWKITHSN